MTKIAIFGGTFNPLHIGHYEMLSALENDIAIDKILLLPDKIPPHKECDFMADDETRIKMCSLAAEDFSKAELCLIEFEREGKSYTYDTVKLLKQKYKGCELYFVCGGDMLVYFDKWYKYEELMKELSFIVFKRGDTDIAQFDACVKRFSEMGMKIIVKDELISTVSSTEIRSDFKNAAHFLPTKIYDYLSKKGIYND